MGGRDDIWQGDCDVGEGVGCGQQVQGSAADAERLQLCPRQQTEYPVQHLVRQLKQQGCLVGAGLLRHVVCTHPVARPVPEVCPVTVETEMHDINDAALIDAFTSCSTGDEQLLDASRTQDDKTLEIVFLQTDASRQFFTRYATLFELSTVLVRAHGKSLGRDRGRKFCCRKVCNRDQ